MDEYLSTGVWFGVPAFLIAWIASMVYAVGEYGWFIGLPLGFFIGGFFGFLASLVAALLWPLIAIGIFGIVYLIANA